MRGGAFFAAPRGARITPSEARHDEALIIIAGDMFAAGFDTKDISLRLLTPECAALAALHVARERQRAAPLSDANRASPARAAALEFNP
jgi:hypothetical protein